MYRLARLAHHSHVFTQAFHNLVYCFFYSYDTRVHAWTRDIELWISGFALYALLYGKTKTPNAFAHSVLSLLLIFIRRRYHYSPYFANSAYFLAEICEPHRALIRVLPSGSCLHSLVSVNSISLQMLRLIMFPFLITSYVKKHYVGEWHQRIMIAGMTALFARYAVAFLKAVRTC